MFLDQLLRAQTESPRTQYTGLIELAQGVVGVMGLSVRDQQRRTGDISYVVNPDHWNRSIATRAGNLMIDLGFRELGLYRVFGTCDPRNFASARVLQKLGLRYEHTLSRTQRIRDGWRDSAAFGLSRCEWAVCSDPGVRRRT